VVVVASPADVSVVGAGAGPGDSLVLPDVGSGVGVTGWLPPADEPPAPGCGFPLPLPFDAPGPTGGAVGFAAGGVGFGLGFEAALGLRTFGFFGFALAGVVVPFGGADAAVGDAPGAPPPETEGAEDGVAAAGVPAAPAGVPEPLPVAGPVPASPADPAPSLVAPAPLPFADPVAPSLAVSPPAT
jgi:hypothetical protein